MNTWFTSDTHFSHRNICQYSGRPWSSVEEMNEALIENWNARVKPGDQVYHLGDFAFVKDTPTVEALIKRLKGQIHLVRGNHDHTRTRSAKGFVEVVDLKEIKVGEQTIILCHYPLASWSKMHHGTWMLHGHCHGTLAKNPHLRRVDVGVDPMKYAPVSFEELVVVMQQHDFVPVDHHGTRDED